MLEIEDMVQLAMNSSLEETYTLNESTGKFWIHTEHFLKVGYRKTRTCLHVFGPYRNIYQFCCGKGPCQLFHAHCIHRAGIQQVSLDLRKYQSDTRHKMYPLYNL